MSAYKSLDESDLGSCAASILLFIMPQTKTHSQLQTLRYIRWGWLAPYAVLRGIQAREGGSNVLSKALELISIGNPLMRDTKLRSGPRRR